MTHQKTVEALRDSGKHIYVLATGAGAGLQKTLWDVPGISSALVGAGFPYDTAEIDDTLGFKPTQYASLETAIDLAQEAYMRAWAPGREAVGLGLSASVASNRLHRGDHRIFAATVSATGCRTLSVILKKGEGSEQRRLDGEISDLVGLDLLAAEVTGTRLLDSAGERYGFSLKESTEDALALQRLFEHPFFLADGTRSPTPVSGKGLALFPGAFNPPHEGHFGIADAVERLTGKRRFVFEITADSAHKPHLKLHEMLQRAKLLRGRNRLLTQGCPLYQDKAIRFPGVHLVVGADTLRRMYDPTWCPNPEALTVHFLQHHVRAIVFGRKIGEAFVSSREAVTRVMRPFVEHYLDGRWDVSSSNMRG